MPKADPFTQRRLLDLAAVDRSVGTARHRRTTLPELAEIAAGEQALAGLRNAVITAETEVGDLDRDGRKLDAEIETVRARADRDAARLSSGAGSPKELENLQHEITSLARRQGVLEDDALELMERRETADEVLAGATREFDAATASLDAARARRDAVFAEVDAELETLAAQRSEVAAPLPADVLALYEKVHATGRTAAAELTGDTCGACKLGLDRVEVGRLRSAPADEVARCPECGAILIRA
ncbi:hypothetical protein GIS00_25650 [Nakamurella sp. YIM 132087]|uniref:C4-type zinc ribbon domain-containing protein n=1 Tax=Nakamurella alba TaxID=2665158 RepID=A0A7K1FT76_9ACTN|nr:C4-type zinc ribbon domain-containing protein [Nakamurella alba]MTD17321.1 hypothetical protein [Nakamurella alba]